MRVRLIILLLFIPLFNFGQHRFSYIDIEDDLTENSVTEIFQDSEGYLWFATQDGISQYDGYQFKNYNISNNDSLSLSDNYLWGFIEDSLGFLWVCSRNGLNRIDKKTGKTIQFFINSSGSNGENQVADIAIYQGDLFALISGKICKIYIKQDYVNRINYIVENDIIETGSDTIYAFYKDGENIFFLQSDGLFNFTTKELMPISEFQKGITHTFFKATRRKELLWFTNGKKLYAYNSKTQQINSFRYDFEGATMYDLLTVKNELWVATDNGIFIFDDNKLIHHITKNQSNESGISSNIVAALAQDKTGKIWVGTSGNGINVYNPNRDKFKYLSKETLGGDYIIRSIVQTKNNQLIVCTSNKVIVLELYDITSTQSKFASDNVKSIQELKVKGHQNIVPTKVFLGLNGDILLGTKGNDIIVLDKYFKFKKKVTLNIEQQPTNVVSDIILTQKDEFWVATYYGIYVLDKAYDLIQVFSPDEKGLTTNYFLSVFEDTENEIWLGSNKGVYKYNETTNKFINYSYQKNNLQESPGFNFVCGFTDFGDGNLWMATYGGGLSKMDKKKGTFRHFTTENGLANNVCNGLLSDQTKNIWLNTNKGISRFNSKTEKFINYTKSDGLDFNEFNLNSFYKNEEGEMFFGTPIGLVIFNPEDIKISNYQPPVIISRVDVNYKNESQRLQNNHIDIYSKDKVLTIHYVGLNFSNSPKIKYKYRLVGYDEVWVETNELKANYTSLPDGEFTFAINTTNADGIWNETPKEIVIVVHPPIYKTWWFISLSGLIVLVLVGLVIRYFAQRNIKKRLRELRVQQEIHHEKQRISRDLHDNIGAQITYLISSIDQEAYTSKQEDVVFDRLSDKARNVMSQLRQTIWVISKEAINLSDFAQKVRDYSTKMLSLAGINVFVQVNGNENSVLAPTIVSHLFRILQEAQNNIIKHAQASEVKIELSVQNNCIYLFIEDNGIGMGEIKTWDDHFGLKNMKDRVVEMKGNLTIGKTEEGIGTRISIEVPIVS